MKKDKFAQKKKNFAKNDLVVGDGSAGWRLLQLMLLNATST